MMEWLGGSFDPEAFDRIRINKHLQKLKMAPHNGQPVGRRADAARRRQGVGRSQCHLRVVRLLGIESQAIQSFKRSRRRVSHERQARRHVSGFDSERQAG